VAEKIADDLREVAKLEVAVNELKEVDYQHLAGFDAIVIGSPNHMGRATMGIIKFIDSLGKLNLEGKLVAVFDTYMGGDFEKAVKKMEKQIALKALKLKLATPGLSMRVEKMQGPITQGELSRCKDFASKITTQLGELKR
jgi:flavodoxin